MSSGDKKRYNVNWSCDKKRYNVNWEGNWDTEEREKGLLGGQESGRGGGGGPGGERVCHCTA